MEYYIKITEQYPWVAIIAGIICIIIAAWLTNALFKRIILRGIKNVLASTSYGRDEELTRHSVIPRLANIMPAIVIIVGIGLIDGLPHEAVTVIRNVCTAFIILTIVLALSATLNIFNVIYSRRADANLRPIKGYLQLAKIIIFIVAVVLIIAVLIDRSPLILLSGLGAMAAVLMLVFQDTLLSLVASVQISSSDMVRVGDWIEMPQLNADGDVIDIALHTVKVQNWDKTITTLPTRRLITDPFKNWRGMQESGGRRIKRSIYLDQNSICFLSDEEAKKLACFSLLDTYINNKQKEIHQWNSNLGDKADNDVNKRRITNIGTFRVYVENYLRASSRINQQMTMIVRQLSPTPNGLPLEIYCFTNTVKWVEYESIQSDIFDHLLAIMPRFGLRVFQNPGGADMREFTGINNKT